MKLIKETLFENEISSDFEAIPIYRIRMVKDIEFTPDEINEYMKVNSLNESDMKKVCTGLAKVKWRNMVNNALESKNPDAIKEINDTAFKYYI